jgi:hypothetical protein
MVLSLQGTKRNQSKMEEKSGLASKNKSKAAESRRIETLEKTCFAG